MSDDPKKTFNENIKESFFKDLEKIPEKASPVIAGEAMKYWNLARRKDGTDEVVSMDCVVEYMKSIQGRIDSQSPWRLHLGEYALRISPMETNQLHMLTMHLTDKVAELSEKLNQLEPKRYPAPTGTAEAVLTALGISKKGSSDDNK